MKKTTKLLLVASCLSFLAVGCTKKENSEAPTSAKNEAVSNKLEISSVGETMAFDKTEMTAKANQPITVTMHNDSHTLKHNWVLVKPGTENDVGIAGIQAGEAKNFIPDSPNVLAHTKLIDAIGSDGKVNDDTTAPFTLAAGDYPYICTNAGHHTVMKGVLHVVP